MENEISPITEDPIKTFQENVAKKVREDIADMMPEEAIHALAAQAVKEIFFEPRQVRVNDNSYGGHHMETTPSIFNKAIAEAAKPLIEAQAKEIFEEHKAVIEAHLRDLYADHKLMLELLKVVQSQSEAFTQTMAQNVVTEIRNSLSQ